MRVRHTPRCAFLFLSHSSCLFCFSIFFPFSGQALCSSPGATAKRQGSLFGSIPKQLGFLLVLLTFTKQAASPHQWSILRWGFPKTWGKVKTSGQRQIFSARYPFALGNPLFRVCLYSLQSFLPISFSEHLGPNISNCQSRCSESPDLSPAFF